VPSREQKQWQHYRENKEMRKVRKQIKRHRQTQRVRRKDWMPGDLDDLDALYDLPTSEPIMPPGERERREAALAEAMARLREEGSKASPPSLVEGQRGVVVEVGTGLCRVDVGDQLLLCGVRGSLSAVESGYTNVVAVGDEVIVSLDGSDRGIVETVLPRRNVLARPDVFRDGARVRDRHLQQVIVANVDQLLIVASWRDPHFWPELVDRYLIAGQRNSLPTVICVNKVDLAPDLATCRRALEPYLGLGYQVLSTSAVTGEGVSELRQLLRGRTTVLAGMSGVGKSSLLNAVQPGLDLRRRTVSDRTGEGRHTTTQVSLYPLETGGAVADTPGIRELGLRGLMPEELIRYYPDLAAAGQDCRFSNCSHTHEPDCAVRAAVKGGQVSKARYHSYRRIYEGLPI
jgi:ribosome biogenesis GTPase